MGKVENTPGNEAKCKCPHCPTWMANECPKEKDENLYCAKGRTACDLPEAGCLCGACAVFAENGLSKGYFCFSGEVE
jgi:hypothetical protein